MRQLLLPNSIQTTATDAILPSQIEDKEVRFQMSQHLTSGSILV